MSNAGGLPPLVTVALPVYNAGRHLRLAIASIVRQTFTDWELLVLDDGSSDGALDHLTQELGDSRIKVLRDGCNMGIAVRLNQAVDLARGQYFARMDADDISFPERFARQVAALQADGTLDLVATRAITVDEFNHVSGSFPYALSHADICARPWLGFHLPHPTWMGKTEWFRSHRYTVPAPYLCEDQELLLRTYRSSRFTTIDEVLFAYRVNTSIDWHRFPKIRRAMAKYQLRYFVRSGQWHFAVMALLALPVKRCLDQWRQWTCDPHLPKTHGISTEMEHHWRGVLQRVADDPRAS
ncbi:glycosyltransferase family 2 protein [Rhodoferax sp. WC2427]|uniref:glycosyltransferase family 2 protein n=1 Tax=Rhodoferax sp. WC2427 TaxID=3234144 RepID=UPI00346714EF